MHYLMAFFAAALLVSVLASPIRYLAARYRIVDHPDEPRKTHPRPTPLLGGIAIYLSLIVVLWYIALATSYFLDSSIRIKHLFGITVGGLVLILGGYLDDRYDLKPLRQIIFPILAALVIVGSGIGIRVITNPFGGIISLVWWEKALFWWQGVGYRVTLPADLLTFIWLMVLMYSTKLLDGLDGLVSGITTIGAVMIFLLATVTKFFQPEVAMLAVLVAGVLAGFLVWNWHPAKIFLGTGGSTLAGFLLGVLAIISGGKLATALLVLGIPILDLLWVALRRIFKERRSLFLADRGHLHFRLLESGFSHRQSVLILWALAALFGTTTLFLQSKAKLIALGMLVLLMIGLAFYAVIKSTRCSPKL